MLSNLTNNRTRTLKLLELSDTSGSFNLFNLESISRIYEQQFKYAGLETLTSRLKFLVVILTPTVIIAVAIAYVNFYISLLVVPLGVLFVKFQIDAKSIKRSQSFEKDYTAFLLALASAIRTGKDPLSALLCCKQLFTNSSLVYQELVKIEAAFDQGLDEEKLINLFASSVKHPDIQLFRTAFILARKHGSSLALSLQRLVKVTRQRQSFRRRSSSAIAMQRLSVFGILVCAIVVCSIQFAADPEQAISTLNDPIGIKVLAFGFSCIGIGTFWMLKITATKI